MEVPRRSVIREQEFEEQLDALICNAAAEDILSEDPTLGALADEGPPEIWTLALPPVSNRAVSMFYTFNDEFVSSTWSPLTEHVAATSGSDKALREKVSPTNTPPRAAAA